MSDYFNGTTKPTPNEQLQINALRNILLKEDRQSAEKIETLLASQAEEMRAIEKKLVAQLEQLENNFPQAYNTVINKMISQKLQSSQNEILDILYPKLGLLIQKYIAHQIELLREQLLSYVKQLFEKSKPRSLWQRVFNQNPLPDIQPGDLQFSKLQEIFIVQKSTGLLIAQASDGITQPKRDIVAGMLTAVKGFMEDAFLTEADELEQIRYGYYTLLLFNFPTYYYVLAFTGNFSEADSHSYFIRACTFSQLYNLVFTENVTDGSQIFLSEKLKSCFLTNSDINESPISHQLNTQNHD